MHPYEKYIMQLEAILAKRDERIAEQSARIALLATELRRRIESERDIEIGHGKTEQRD